MPGNDFRQAYKDLYEAATKIGLDLEWLATQSGSYVTISKVNLLPLADMLKRGKAIMSLKKHTIVVISGKMGSGKSTLSDQLIARYSGVSIKFAGPLYEMQEAIRGVLAKYGIEMPKKVGSLLQYLGTEFGRKLFGDDVWVRCMHSAIHSAIEKIEKWDKAFIVVDDTRFKNELDYFLGLANSGEGALRILTVRLEADEEIRKSRAESWRENTRHQSEVDLDDRLEDFDMVVNTGSGLNSATNVFWQVCKVLDME